MHTTIKINTNQLDVNFLDAIRNLFKDQEVEISIRNLGETEYLLSNEANRNHLAESIAEYGQKEVTTFTLEEFYKKYEAYIGDE
jgi:hypothetical protein